MYKAAIHTYILIVKEIDWKFFVSLNENFAE